jgi:hypothetical protein
MKPLPMQIFRRYQCPCCSATAEMEVADMFGNPARPRWSCPACGKTLRLRLKHERGFQIFFMLATPAFLLVQSRLHLPFWATLPWFTIIFFIIAALVSRKRMVSSTDQFGRPLKDEETSGEKNPG